MNIDEWDGMVRKISKILKVEYEAEGELNNKVQELLQVTRELQKMEQKIIEQRLPDKDLKTLNIHRAEKISQQINAGAQDFGDGVGMSESVSHILQNYYSS